MLVKAGADDQDDKNLLRDRSLPLILVFSFMASALSVPERLVLGMNQSGSQESER